MLVLENFGNLNKKLNLSSQLVSIKNENKVIKAEIIMSNGLMKLIQTQSLSYFNNGTTTFIIDSSVGSSRNAMFGGYTLDSIKGTVTINVKI